MWGGWMWLLVACDPGGVPAKEDPTDDTDPVVDTDAPDDSDPADDTDVGADDTDVADDSDPPADDTDDTVELPEDTGTPPPDCLVEAWRAEIGPLGGAVGMDEVSFVLPSDNGGAWVVGRGVVNGERHTKVLAVAQSGQVAWEIPVEVGQRSKVRAAVRGAQGQLVLAIESESTFNGVNERNVAVARVNPDQSIPWLQQYGVNSRADEQPVSVALDAGGDAWVTGPAGADAFVLRVSNGLGVINTVEVLELGVAPWLVAVDDDQLPVLAYGDPTTGAQVMLGLERDADVRWSTALDVPVGGAAYTPLLAPGDGEGVRVLGLASGADVLFTALDARGDVSMSAALSAAELGLTGVLDVTSFSAPVGGSYTSSGDAIFVARGSSPWEEALVRLDGDDASVRWSALLSDQSQRSFDLAVGIQGGAFAGGGDGRGAVLSWHDAATGALQCAQRPLYFPAQTTDVGWMEAAPAGGVLVAFERALLPSADRYLTLVRYEVP